MCGAATMRVARVSCYPRSRTRAIRRGSDVTRRADWVRVEAVFHEVADLPWGPGRDRKLADLCAGDDVLRAEVQGLLDEEAATREPVEPEHDPHVGLRLGPYTITRRIARGGMAVVYEGQRDDGAFTQRVAVKIMDARLSDPALAPRFRAERQILAGLEHPHVTRLVDGGVTALGEPYLVMDYVDGQPLDAYCDERRLGVEQRLALFAQVCDAVAYAHRTLVLHRDLKPSNILVTADGHVKVVDFGTATLLQPDRLATTSAAPLTPAYASPEQLTGKPVGTASDQYSLGVVLFELLTGATPFGDRPSLLSAIERAVAGTTSTAPHAAVTEAAAAVRQTSLVRLRRVLSRDLGTIVTKALAPEPAARYASVPHLADDLARWRNGEAIEGRAPSVAYRISRFVQRHWVATGIAATLALALAGSTVVSARQAEIARVESQKARQLNQFLADMLSSADPVAAARPGGLTVQEVLDKAAPRISTALASSPEAEAELLLVIGNSYQAMGAGATAETYLRRALQRFTELGDPVGAARANVGIGSSLVSQGKFVDGEQALRAGRAEMVAHPAAFDGRTRLLAANGLALARTYQRVADDEALALYRGVLADPDAETTAAEAGAQAASNLGLQLVLGGQLEEAERALRDAIRRYGAIGANSSHRFATSRSMSELMRTMRNYPEAVRHGREAVAGFAALLPAGHPFHPATKTSLGRALVLNGEVEEGARILQEAMDLFLAIRPKGHMDLIGTQLGLGAAYRMQGRLADSERILREALAASAKGTIQLRPGALGELGLTLRALGRTDEARRMLQESHDIFVSYLPPGHPYIAMAQARLDGATQ